MHFHLSEPAARLISEELGWLSVSLPQNDRFEAVRKALQSLYPSQESQLIMDAYFENHRRYALMHATYAQAPVWDYGFDVEKVEPKFRSFFFRKDGSREHRGLYGDQKLRVVLDHARDVVARSGRSNQDIGNRLKRVLNAVRNKRYGPTKTICVCVDGQFYEAQYGAYRSGGTLSPFSELRKASPSLAPAQRTNEEFFLKNLQTGQAIRCTPHLPEHIMDFGCYIEPQMNSSIYDPRFEPNVERVLAVLGLELPPA